MDKTHKLITAVMAAQILNDLLFDLNTNGMFKHRDKMIVSNCLSVLEQIELKHYDRFFESNSDSTSMVYDSYQRFLTAMARVPIYDCEIIINLYNKYNEERTAKASEGIPTGY